mgnify:CR=1 FL=1
MFKYIVTECILAINEIKLIIVKHMLPWLECFRPSRIKCMFNHLGLKKDLEDHSLRNAGLNNPLLLGMSEV